MAEKVVAVDKVRLRLSGSPDKSTERVGRNVSRTRLGAESPDRKGSMSSSPRKKDSVEPRRRKGRRSRSRSKSPQKSVSSLAPSRRSSGSSVRVSEVHQTTKLPAGNNQDQLEDFYDETGSSVSLDV